MLKSKTLVVDLDHTLIKTDMLHECFWSAFARNIYTPLTTLWKLLKSRSAMKSYLASESDVDVQTLPYDEVVMDYVKKFRQEGGYVVLVTATYQGLADRVADHLKIFDEAHGSNGVYNLKGDVKAKFLIEHFGEENFYYMGDSYADLAVWAVSDKVITVNASITLRKKAEAFGKVTEHLKTYSKSLSSYMKALRPHQWVKNLLVFLPMLVSHRLDVAALIDTSLAFAAFCLIASSVYLLNDLLDLKADRKHPRKSLRPFASGEVSISHGSMLAFALILAGSVLGSSIGMYFALVLGVYYLITLGYSLFLKRKVVIDICILATLYTIRIVAGGASTGLDLSVWLIAFSIFFFLSLGSVKRQSELVDLSKRGETNAEGRGYQATDLPIMLNISLSSGYISILVLALYINSPNVTALYSTPAMLWPICFVLIYWLTRAVFIAHRGNMHDDPVVFALKDKISQYSFIIILMFAILGAVA